MSTDSVNEDPGNEDPGNDDSGNDEEYRGPATLCLDDGPVPVEIRMSAYFEPTEGRFRWAGRTGPHAALRERVGGGLRKATIVVPGSPETTVKLSDPDPWGGIRISGTGTPPWFRATASTSTSTAEAGTEVRNA
ncbi:DUF4873 domain-containing protein [Actinoplanes sp. NPDC023801]|uniref:DUF4873 domain-containing protein n=1 Tax=Actinoplanes sp. NPDC023801 TaxID=3154595 RepID=UPI0033C28140